MRKKVVLAVIVNQTGMCIITRKQENAMSKNQKDHVPLVNILRIMRLLGPPNVAASKILFTRQIKALVLNSTLKATALMARCVKHYY